MKLTTISKIKNNRKKVKKNQKSAKSNCSYSEIGSFWFLGVSGILSNQHASNSFRKYGTHGAGIYLLYTISKSTPRNHLCYFIDWPLSDTPKRYFTYGFSNFLIKSFDLKLKKLGNSIIPFNIFW